MIGPKAMVLLCGLMAAAALAQPAPEQTLPTSPPASLPAGPFVRLETELGPIDIGLESVKAPATVANFLRYVDGKRFDGTVFYRAMLAGEPGSFGLIQGGTRGEVKRLLPPVKHEPTSQTGLTNKDGAIAMARAAPGSAQGDFFLILGDLSGLDAKPAGEGDPDGFAVFGRVVGGRDTVVKIQSAPTSATLGEGPMKGQMLEKPVKIVKASRIAAPLPVPVPAPVPEPAPQG